MSKCKLFPKIFLILFVCLCMFSLTGCWFDDIGKGETDANANYNNDSQTPDYVQSFVSIFGNSTQNIDWSLIIDNGKVDAARGKYKMEIANGNLRRKYVMPYSADHIFLNNKRIKMEDGKYYDHGEYDSDYLKYLYSTNSQCLKQVLNLMIASDLGQVSFNENNTSKNIVLTYDLNEKMIQIQDQLASLYASEDNATKKDLVDVIIRSVLKGQNSKSLAQTFKSFVNSNTTVAELSDKICSISPYFAYSIVMKLWNEEAGFNDFFDSKILSNKTDFSDFLNSKVFTIVEKNEYERIVEESLFMTDDKKNDWDNDFWGEMEGDSRQNFAGLVFKNCKFTLELTLQNNLLTKYSTNLSAEVYGDDFYNIVDFDIGASVEKIGETTVSLPSNVKVLDGNNR